jgi:hypothetical protein
MDMSGFPEDEKLRHVGDILINLKERVSPINWIHPINL